MRASGQVSSSGSAQWLSPFKGKKMGAKKIFEVFLKGLVILLDIMLAMLAFLMAICEAMS